MTNDDMNRPIQKSDYEEACCPLNMHPEVTPIPIGRVIEKLDSCLNRDDYPAAERLLTYWISEARAGGDMRGMLTLLNEQIGLYRKTGKKEECFRAVSEALSLAESMHMEHTVTYGTTLVNAATGYKAFGDAETALPLYRRARAVYEAALDASDARLGGLYNNMALALTECGAYREAEELYYKAIRIMEKQENGALESAITCLNLADLVTAEAGFEAGEQEIERLLRQAESLLDTESLPRDGYYAFVCEKCASVFGYYGHFLTEQELNRRVREIHERT